MGDLAQLKRDIRGFSFEKCDGGSQGFTRLLLQLFGFLGHGKSSFINTCKYILDDGQFRNIAQAKCPTGGGTTTARLTYPLTQSITLVDNRGCSSINDYEKGEIFAQLANLLPLDEEVNWKDGLGLLDRVFQDSKINNSDFIVPIFIFSAKMIPHPKDEETLRDILLMARDLTGIFPIVVLTHREKGNALERERRFKAMGVEQVLAVENYTVQNHLKTRGRDLEVLEFFVQVIKDVKFRMTHLQNPEQQRRNRTHLVLKYCSERQMSLLSEEKDMEKVSSIASMTTTLKKLQEENEKERERDRKIHEYEMRLQKGRVEEMEREREQERELLQMELRKLQEEIHKIDLHMKNKKMKKNDCTVH